jgi:DNA polymerase (family 10)
MDNRALIKAFRLTAQLLELHDENAFKIRAYEGTATALEQLEFPVAEIERPGLPDRTGLSKTQAAKVAELLDTGSFKELQELLDKTPSGVVDLLNIKGIGPKKVRALWREAGIESPEQLREAAEAGQVAKLKGFGAKTQESLLAALAFTDQSAGKLLFSQAEQLANDLAARLRQLPGVTEVAATGEVRRALEIVETIELLVASPDPAPIHELLNAAPGLRHEAQRSGPFAWRGTVADSGVGIVVRVAAPADFVNQLFVSTGNEAHLSALLPQACKLAPVGQARALRH